MFDVGASVARPQGRHQCELVVGARREVGMAGLGRHGPHPSIDAVQDRLAQSGARGDERGVAGGGGAPDLQRVQLVAVQHGHGVRHRLEVVQQTHVADAGRRGHLDAADAPRHVGHGGDAVADGSGHAQRHDLHARIEWAQGGVQQVGQPGVVERAHGAHVEQMRARPRALEQSHERLRSADVGRKNHGRIVCARPEMPAKAQPKMN